MDTSNYGWGLPVAASTYAADIDRGLFKLHAVMIALFLVMGTIFIFFLIRYRARPGHAAQHGHGGRLPFLIPALILIEELYLIFSYAIPVWSKVVIDLPDPKDSNVIEVVAEQFVWNFHYPGADGKFGKRSTSLISESNPLGLDPEDQDGKDDVMTMNELRIPVGKPTLAYLTAKDVIHSFFIPEFRIKKDCTPGLRQPIWFEPSQTGSFEIVCSQLCGNGHSAMRGNVLAMPQAEFEAWLKSQTTR